MIVMETNPVKTHRTSDTAEAAYYWSLGYRCRVEHGRPRSSFVFESIPGELTDAYHRDVASTTPKQFWFAYKSLMHLLHQE